MPNPFGVNHAHFICNTNVLATKNPLPPPPGTVTGAQVVGALRTATGKRDIGTPWARSLRAGADPEAPSSAMQIRDDNSGYGLYVVETDAGPALFVELAQ